MLALQVPFVLASQSPRRRLLLQQLGLTFTVQPHRDDEVWPDGLPPSVAVETLAIQKAAPVAALNPEALTLGADTIVVLEEEVLGKPRDATEAHAMLRRLSGATHIVYTGIALAHPASGRQVATHEATTVTFAALREEEIQAYVASGSPLDKAGAYGIQDDHGALFVRRIDGDYYTVVGLPLHRLYHTLQTEFGDLLKPLTAS